MSIILNSISEIHYRFKICCQISFIWLSKKIWNTSYICKSFLLRGHANLFSVLVPILEFFSFYFLWFTDLFSFLLYVCFSFWCFEIGPQVAQTGLELDRSLCLRRAFNSWSSYPHLPSAGNTGVCQHAQLCQIIFMKARELCKHAYIREDALCPTDCPSQFRTCSKHPLTWTAPHCTPSSALCPNLLLITPS